MMVSDMNVMFPMRRFEMRKYSVSVNPREPARLAFAMQQHISVRVRCGDCCIHIVELLSRLEDWDGLHLHKLELLDWPQCISCRDVKARLVPELLLALRRRVGTANAFLLMNSAFLKRMVCPR